MALVNVTAPNVTVVPETVPALPMVCHAEVEVLKNARKTEPAGAVAKVKLEAGRPVMLDAADAVRLTYTSAVFGVAAAGFSDCVVVPDARATDERTGRLPGGLELSEAFTLPLPATVTELVIPLTSYR